MFKVEAQRTENWATVRKPKDRRNGQFSGVERRTLNPAPSFLLLISTLSRPKDVSKGAGNSNRYIGVPLNLVTPLNLPSRGELSLCLI